MRLLREPSLASPPPPTPQKLRDFSGAEPGSRWLSSVCVESGRAPHVAAGSRPGGTPSPQHSHAGVTAATSPSRSHGPSLGVRASRPHPDGRAQPVRVSPSPGPYPGPNSIVLGLMNSRALIRSPGALWIYACRLSSRGRRESCRGSFRRRRSWDSLGPWRRGALPPGRGIAGAGTRARAPCPVPRPGPAEPQRLPASPGLSRAAPLAPPHEAGAQSRSPHPRPEPPPQVRDARGRRPAWAARPLPLSLRIPLIRGLFAALRLRGCWGRPAGVLETVLSLSPFIKRPWAALKPRSQ